MSADDDQAWAMPRDGGDRIYLSVPHMSGRELDFVREAFASNWLSTVGPQITVLEEAMGSMLRRPAVALSSGTAGLHLALKLLGVGAGDEVVSPTLTFVASVNAIRYLAANPVLIDSERTSWNLDPGLLETFLAERARINRLPKAVMVVHLFGQPAALDPILELCKRYELPLIEDAAESLGSRYRDRHPGTSAISAFTRSTGTR